MREIYIKSKAGLLPIGRKGENLATRVIYPGVPEEGQAVTVFVKRNGDSVAYPASQVEVTDTEVIWTVTSVDTNKQGRGQVQYRFSDSVTGEVIKTDVYGFLVGLAIDTEVGPAPDPYETWLDSLTDLAGQAQVAARDAEANATQAAESAESASESAQNAEQSATSAGTHAANALNSATTASQKAAQAAESEANAQTYATQAQASAESAGASATSAEESAESASASADSASESKTDAGAASQSAHEWGLFSQTYASQAAASATAASQSATAASASATSASQSATTATAKASEASASATTATIKATEASASATAAQAAQTGAETAQAGAESAAQTAQAGADAVGLLREQIYNSYPNVTAETAPIVSITDGADGIPVKSLAVGIEPVQEGTGDPSPTNVRPITGWTGAKVTRTGKNLLQTPYYDRSKTEYGITYTVNNDGSISLSGTNNKGETAYFGIVNRKFPKKLKKGSYSVGRTGIAGVILGIASRNADNTHTVALAYANETSDKVFTLSEDTLYYSYISIQAGVTVNATFYPRLELGSTATSYEPYQGETYDIAFPSEAGTVYGGSLDVTTGVLTVTKGLIASYAGEALPGAWISDRDVYAEGVTPTTGAQIVYELATPITYQLTPTEVTTLLGSNNIWADTGDTSLAYRADTKLYIDGVYEEYQDDLADYSDALAALG